ncbi:MAG: COX15/CtaA family protein [Candidatus Methylacidiphilales bacterium]|nr:COX15/CtaA family protein [Candidatus Methylacidiphilales bacterium]
MTSPSTPPSGLCPPASVFPQPPSAVGYWLLAVAVAIWIMVGIGGVTRLTGSGLSITDWRPLTGAIPPLSDADWQSEFAKYMGSPQHRLVFPDMTVEEFKGIYWWEWIHRFWGRMIGVVFALPLLVFWVRGMIPPTWRGRLLLIFLLGGLQGALGWFMVASGLVDRPSVSPYRLAAHLGLAVILFAWVLWLALVILCRQEATTRERGAGAPREWHVAAMRLTLPGTPALFFLLLLLVQIIYGGFMAGTKAAMAHPTFPDLSGSGFPPAATWTQPGWRNFFENTAVIAFTHRWLGILVFLVGAWQAVRVIARGPSRLRRPAGTLGLLLLLQVALGIGTTLLAQGHIPVLWGSLHQLNALLILALGLYLFHSYRQSHSL